MKKLILISILAGMILGGCTLTRPDQPEGEWWENAVFYEIFVRSFYDSDCDGIGDFNGITQKLDYLQDLGITALWLMPIHPSPSYHGYDVINYYAANYEYGSLDDFKNLVAEAHQRGIRVIIDLVLNHTSNQHPWFVDAEAHRDSPYRDWYLWSATYPGYNGPLGVAWHSGSTGYYYGVFWSGMPDLNYTNPEVTAEMEEVAQFWLDDVGVDGFRVDAAKHLIEEGENQENTDSTHAWFRQFNTFYKSENPQAYTVGEVFGAGAFLAKTYTGDQFDHVFNFDLAYGFLNSAKNEKNQAANSALTFTLKDMPDGNYATFLTNHDQDRVMNVLNGEFDKAKTAAALLLTAPGTPYIYYGEEIGMMGKKPDEDIRRPMQWSAAANAGFSCPQGWPWRDPDPNYVQVNVEAQQDDDASLLSRYQQLIELRLAHPALRTGSTTLLDSSDRGLFASLRATSGEQLLVLLNLGETPIVNPSLSVAASPLEAGKHRLEAIQEDLGQRLTVDEGGGFSFELAATLQPYQVLILEVK